MFFPFLQVRVRLSFRRSFKSKEGVELWTPSMRFKRSMMLSKRYKRISRSCTKCSLTWQCWCNIKVSNWMILRAMWQELLRLCAPELSSCRLHGSTKRTPGNGPAIVSCFFWWSSCLWCYPLWSHGKIPVVAEIGVVSLHQLKHLHHLHLLLMLNLGGVWVYISRSILAYDLGGNLLGWPEVSFQSI